MPYPKSTRNRKTKTEEYYISYNMPFLRDRVFLVYRTHRKHLVPGIPYPSQKEQTDESKYQAYLTISELIVKETGSKKIFWAFF